MLLPLLIHPVGIPVWVLGAGGEGRGERKGGGGRVSRPWGWKEEKDEKEGGEGRGGEGRGGEGRGGREGGKKGGREEVNTLYSACMSADTKPHTCACACTHVQGWCVQQSIERPLGIGTGRDQLSQI